jgi:monothiol glutaredoxin
MLFMKGSPAMPQCGFSAAVVQILKQVGVPFGSVNILADAELREGLKQYANWPTFPQLYLDGKLVGGCDIVRDMHARGRAGAAAVRTVFRGFVIAKQSSHSRRPSLSQRGAGCLTRGVGSRTVATSMEVTQ